MPPVPIYLDFDGVMNSFSRDTQRLTTRTGFGRWRFVDSKHQEEGRCFPLALSDDRNQEVSSWCGLGAEIVWLTTWWQAPDDVVAQTGIDAPFAAPRASLTGSRDWKAAVIESRIGTTARPRRWSFSPPSTASWPAASAMSRGVADAPEMVGLFASAARRGADSTRRVSITAAS